MGFLRSFFRRRTRPMEPQFANKMKTRLSIIYFFAAWNGFAYGVYVFLQRNDAYHQREGESSVEYYSRILGKKDATLFQYTDGKLTDVLVLPSESELKSKTSAQTEREHERTAPDENLELLVEETLSL